jgi:hypothetical protein
MPDETSGAASPQGGDAAQTAQAQGAQAEDAQGAQAQQDGGVVVVEALTRKVAELERDNRQYRQQIKAQTEAQRANAEAGMSEVERLKARNLELESALADRTKREQEQSLRFSALAAASRLGFRNPDIAYRLLDPASIEWDESSGSPKNVEKMLEGLAKTDPYLLTQADFGGGPRGASPAATGRT